VLDENGELVLDAEGKPVMAWCFDTENLLFVGASGNIPRYGVQRINFEFEVEHDEIVNPVFFDTETQQVVDGKEKTIKGHQKFWSRAEQSFTASPGCFWEVTLPQSLYVHRVHRTCSFGDEFGPEVFNFPA
jgi:hypothetical protein